MIDRIIGFIIILFIACALTGSLSANNMKKTEGKTYSLEEFPGLLNVKNIPKTSEDREAFCFMDKGAWFGFALPPDAAENYLACFPGPFVLTSGRWLSDKPAKLVLKNMTTGKLIDFSAAKVRTITYYPGRLSQVYDFKDISVKLELIFTWCNTAIIRTKIQNKSTETFHLACGWEGEIFDGPAVLETTGNSVKYVLEKDRFITVGLSDCAGSAKKTGERTYRIDINKQIIIPPNKDETIYLEFFYCMSSSQKFSTQHAANIEKVFEDNRNRWNRYIDSILCSGSRWAEDAAYRNIAVKSLMTLASNWRCAFGDLEYDGLFPSYAVSYFNGFWAWDSWKHAAAILRFDAALAKDQIRAMFARQGMDGMVPDVIYADKSENNLRDTKPPLAAWAVWNVFEQTGDMEFIKEMFPKLLRYHEWWYENRDHDHNGLCEYGSTDGTVEAALWESGMDDAVRFDGRKTVRNKDGAWSLDVESVDLNAYLYAEKGYLSELARRLGDAGTANRLDREGETLKQNIREMMFNKETGFFHDIDLRDKGFLKAQGPEGWIPLWAGVATREQAASVKQVICDPMKFATFIPFPTVSRDSKRFNTGYWRGPVWLDQAYFGIVGLRKYGFHKEADMFTAQLFDRPEGLKNSDRPIRENYDPLTGKGLKVNHFSWSAAHYILIFLSE